VSEFVDRKNADVHDGGFRAIHIGVAPWQSADAQQFSVPEVLGKAA